MTDIGDRSGELVVYHIPKNKERLYCKCSCGRYIKLKKSEFASGEYTSCGHCDDPTPVAKTPDRYNATMRFRHTKGSRIIEISGSIPKTRKNIPGGEQFVEWMNKRFRGSRRYINEIASLKDATSEEDILKAYRTDTVRELVDQVFPSHSPISKQHYRSAVYCYGEFIEQRCATND